MKLDEVKEKLKLEPEKIPLILESLGCHTIKEGYNSFTACRPDGDNKNAVRVKKDTLGTRVFTGKEKVSGSIVDLVMAFKHVNMIQAIEYICSVCGWEYVDNIIEITVTDNLSWLKTIRKKRNKQVEVIANKPLSERFLNPFINLPHNIFYKDGIKINTQKEFEVMFDIANQRIVFPIRDKDGELISIKGRTTLDNFKEMGMPKYYVYHQDKFPIRTDVELFNYYRALPHILEEKEIIVGEAEKFPMQLYPMKKNIVALCCSTLSYAQRKMLQDLALKHQVKIIFAFDKGIDINEVKEQKEMKILKKFATVYYINDKDNYLEDKQSPADKGINVFSKLYSEYLELI